LKENVIVLYLFLQYGGDLYWLQWRKRLHSIITHISCCCKEVS